MAQKIISASKQEATGDELSLEEKLQSTEWRFAEAYVQEGFNLAAAARQVFNVGSKGAAPGQAQSKSAHAMGVKMLDKARTKEYVKELLFSKYTSPEKIMQVFGEILTNKENAVGERIQLGWKLLEEQDMVERQENQAQDHRHIHLNLPARKDD